MAYNELLTNRIRAALAHVPNVTEKNMFRGVAFLVNGKLCLSAGDHEMMCRIDPALHDRLTRKNGCRTVIMKGRAYTGYVYVHEETLQTTSELNDWINLALDFNKQAKASRKRKTKEENG